MTCRVGAASFQPPHHFSGAGSVLSRVHDRDLRLISAKLSQDFRAGSSLDSLHRVGIKPRLDDEIPQLAGSRTVAA